MRDPRRLNTREMQLEGAEEYQDRETSQSQATEKPPAKSSASAAAVISSHTQKKTLVIAYTNAGFKIRRAEAQSIQPESSSGGESRPVIAAAPVQSHAFS